MPRGSTMAGEYGLPGTSGLLTGLKVGDASVARTTSSSSSSVGSMSSTITRTSSGQSTASSTATADRSPDWTVPSSGFAAALQVAGPSSNGVPSHSSSFASFRKPTATASDSKSRDRDGSYSDESEQGKTSSNFRHGDPPFLTGWLGIKTDGILRRPVDRYVELAGPRLIFAATPNTTILGGTYQIFGAEVSSEALGPGHRIHVKTADGERFTLVADTKHEHTTWLNELKRASVRHVNNDYAWEAMGGRTLFGSSTQARDIRTQNPVCVRTVTKSAWDDQVAAIARREAVCLMACPRHPSFVRVYDLYETPSSVYCVTEPVDPNSSIRALVQGQRPLSERDASYVMQSILLSLEKLHAANIRHRACTPDAVHLKTIDDVQDGIKLTSFEVAVTSKDISRDVPSMLSVVRLRGVNESLETSPAPYLAPEVVRGYPEGNQQDVWSAGILMHYMLVASTPFDGPGKTAVDALNVINSAEGMPRFGGVMWNGISSDAKNLCARLLHADPRQRLTPSQALAHRWFRFNL